MVVTLFTKEIINSVRLASHRDVSGIEDADTRYRIEAGSDKDEEIKRCIWEASARLTSRCARWLKASYNGNPDNVMDNPPSFSYEFSISERRALNAESIIEPMHTFMVEYTLAKYYSLINQGELSNKHSMLALDAGNVIDQILYTKQPPRV